MNAMEHASVKSDTLIGALQLLASVRNTEPSPKVTWCQEVPNLMKKPFNKVKVESLGNITIPVSVQNVVKLQKHCQQGAQLREVEDNAITFKEAKNTWEISASQITLSSELKSRLASVFMENLMDSDYRKCEVELELEKLVLYQAGGRFKNHQGRTIGCVILLVPVQGGHQGGRFKFFSSTRSQSTCIETEDNISRLFFSSANLDNNRIEMKPIIKGSLLTIEFKLMFSVPPPMDLPFPLFPAYLSACARIKESLCAWENWTTDLKRHPDIKLESGEMFLIPLQSTFQKTNPSFGVLSDPDLMISELLQSFNFIDVHMAVVAHRVTNDLTPADLLIERKKIIVLEFFGLKNGSPEEIVSLIILI